jgi:hypothetical protein
MKEQRSAREKLTPQQRVLRAQIAAHLSWASTGDRAARTAAARDAALARFGRAVDPENVLPPADRAERALRAYFRQLALKSSKQRRPSG